MDSDEPLAGKCLTCGSLVHCTVRDAKQPVSRFAEKKDYIGAWVDLVSAECPKCGARVFMMPAKDFQRLLLTKTSG